jgi:hypothetical protein
MPSHYDPSAHNLTSGRGQDTRAKELQDVHDRAKKLAGIKHDVGRDDPRHVALVHALLGIKQRSKL